MKVKEMISILNQFEEDREITLTYWDGIKTRFIGLIPSCTPTANSTNILTFIQTEEIKWIKQNRINQ